MHSTERQIAPAVEESKARAERIRSWLVIELADRLGVDVEEVDSERPVTELGLSSVAAVSLAGDLEDWLDTEFSSSLLWEHPTLTALVEHLAGEVDVVPERD